MKQPEQMLLEEKNKYADLILIVLALAKQYGIIAPILFKGSFRA
jgi:hypothetical protein